MNTSLSNDFVDFRRRIIVRNATDTLTAFDPNDPHGTTYGGPAYQSMSVCGGHDNRTVAAYRRLAHEAHPDRQTGAEESDDDEVDGLVGDEDDSDDPDVVEDDEDDLELTVGV